MKNIIFALGFAAGIILSLIVINIFTSENPGNVDFEIWTNHNIYHIQGLTIANEMDKDTVVFENYQELSVWIKAITERESLINDADIFNLISNYSMVEYNKGNVKLSIVNPYTKKPIIEQLFEVDTVEQGHYVYYMID